MLPGLLRLLGLLEVWQYFYSSALTKRRNRKLLALLSFLVGQQGRGWPRYSWLIDIFFIQNDELTVSNILNIWDDLTRYLWRPKWRQITVFLPKKGEFPAARVTWSDGPGVFLLSSHLRYSVARYLAATQTLINRFYSSEESSPLTEDLGFLSH